MSGATVANLFVSVAVLAVGALLAAAVAVIVGLERMRRPCATGFLIKAERPPGSCANPAARNEGNA